MQYMRRTEHEHYQSSKGVLAVLLKLKSIQFVTTSNKKLNCRKEIVCDYLVGQIWQNITGRQYFADIIGLSLTTVT